MSLRNEITENFMLRAKKRLEMRGSLNKFKYADILINCWIAFEAFSCDKYNKEGVQDRIDEFCSSFGEDFKTNFSTLADDLRDSAERLSKLPIKDMRPGHLNDKPKQIKDVKELDQVMDSIYQVRNNLFHGGKNPAEEDDSEKIRLSAILFYFILESFLIKEGFSW